MSCGAADCRKWNAPEPIGHIKTGEGEEFLIRSIIISNTSIHFSRQGVQKGTFVNLSMLASLTTITWIPFVVIGYHVMPVQQCSVGPFRPGFANGWMTNITVVACLYWKSKMFVFAHPRIEVFFSRHI
jgi:hypothetical protein